MPKLGKFIQRRRWFEIYELARTVVAAVVILAALFSMAYALSMLAFFMNSKP